MERCCSSLCSATIWSCLTWVRVLFTSDELRKGGVDNVMDKLQNALRVLLASTIVQCCEAVDVNLARWRKIRVTAHRDLT